MKNQSEKIMKSIWQVIDTESSAMPSLKKVIKEYNNISDAHDHSITDSRYRVRLKPAQRQKKDKADADL